MAIKIQNNIIIDDTRNLDNIASADISGSCTITTNDNSSPALKISQQGSGPCLLIKDSSDPTLAPFVINTDGKVGIGTDSPPASTMMLLSGEDPKLALMQQGVATNGIYGFSIREDTSNLLIDRLEDANHQLFTSLLLISAGNAVVVNPTSAVPSSVLDVRTSARIRNSNNESIYIATEQAATDLNVIASTDRVGGQNRALDFICSNLDVFTGSLESESSDKALGIFANRNALFENSVSANQFVGNGADWFLLSSVDAVGSSIDIAVDVNYKNFTVLFSNLRSTSNSNIGVTLRDNVGSLIGSGTYKYAGIGLRTGSPTLAAPVSSGVSTWNINSFPITPNGAAEGSASGEIHFHDITTINRWKSFNVIMSQFYLFDNVNEHAITFNGGHLDSTTVASTIRFTPDSGTFNGGNIRLYGKRT